MSRMKATLRGFVLAAILLALAAAGGCTESYRSTGDLTVSGRDVVYIRDERTGLCFAVLALQNPAATSVTEMAMTRVPCQALSGLDSE